LHDLYFIFKYDDEQLTQPRIMTTWGFQLIHDSRTQKAADFMTSCSLLVSIHLLTVYLVVDAVDAMGQLWW